MILWRISRHLDLSGAGGLKAPGRWHYAGQLVVYLAETPASALLEVCVHTSANDVPPTFTLLRIEGPNVKIPVIKRGNLPQDWRANQETTRNQGTTWLRKNGSVLLQVPSAIVPETTNFVFNPSHVDAAKFLIAETFSHPFDTRLKKT
ncbi:MAG: RES family NAD+ phosphorylase [Acidobacteriaceae bacterium]